MKKITTILEAHSADYEMGAQDALTQIEELIKSGVLTGDPKKDQQNNKQKGITDGPTGGQKGGQNGPHQKPIPGMEGPKQGGQGGQGGQGSQDDQDDQGQNKSGGSDDEQQNGSRGDRSDKSEPDKNQGAVTEEDMANMNPVENGIPGDFMSKKDGDEIAEIEGHPKEGGDDDAIEREWKDRAEHAISKMPGKGKGWETLKAKLQDIHRSKTDWKKQLKNIVGRSINPDDKRLGFVNKNILVSQERMALTDKDKYNNVDYIMCWIDTSASVSNKMLQQMLCEIYTLANAIKPMKIVIVQFDDGIQEIKEFTNLSSIKEFAKITLKGGGGTNVKPCFDLLVNDKRYRNINPELVMIFTDGYLTQYPRNKRHMQTLAWVIIDNPTFTLENKDSYTKCVHLKLD